MWSWLSKLLQAPQAVFKALSAGQYISWTLLWRIYGDRMEKLGWPPWGDQGQDTQGWDESKFKHKVLFFSNSPRTSLVDSLSGESLGLKPCPLSQCWTSHQHQEPPAPCLPFSFLMDTSGWKSRFRTPCALWNWGRPSCIGISNPRFTSWRYLISWKREKHLFC